jgi:hypothetical protein
VPLDGADGIAVEPDEAGVPPADVAGDEEPAAVVVPDELEHAAASNATGTKAVVVTINRIFLATGEHSFIV